MSDYGGVSSAASSLSALRERINQSSAAPGAVFAEHRIRLISAVHAAHRASGEQEWTSRDQQVLDALDAYLINLFGTGNK